MKCVSGFARAGAVLAATSVIASCGGGGGGATSSGNGTSSSGSGQAVVSGNVWSDSRLAADPSGSEVCQIYGERMSPAGTLLDGGSTGGIELSGNDTRIRFGPTVFFNGTEYLVVWRDSGDASSNGARGIVGVRVSSAGVITSGTNFELTISGLPGVVNNNTQSFSVMRWWDRRRNP